MVTRVVREWGRLDVLVNNAATTKFVDHKNLDGLTEDDWDRMLAVNVKGVFFVTRAAARSMTEGRVINIGSVAGVNGTGSSIAYAASKAAVHVMTRSLARALAPRITVNTLAPGLIETRWHAGHEAAQRGPRGADARQTDRQSRRHRTHGARACDGGQLPHRPGHRHRRGRHAVTTRAGAAAEAPRVSANICLRSPSRLCYNP